MINSYFIFCIGGGMEEFWKIHFYFDMNIGHFWKFAEVFQIFEIYSKFIL